MGNRSGFVSVGAALPEQVITTKDVNRRIFETTGFEINNGLIERLTGVRTRRYRGEDEQSSDLALRAAQQAIERADIDVAEVDLVIFAACTQDITEPATANILQEKLGAKRAQVLDVKNACNSFLNGLDVADSHIRSGKSKLAIVASGETLSLGIDWRIKSMEDLRARISGLTLGDAGAAAVLRAIPDDAPNGILTTRFRSYGDRWRAATVMSGGSMRHMNPEDAYFLSDSAALRESAYSLIPDVVREVYEEIGWTPEDVDVACGHQVTEELVYGIAERCGTPADRNSITVTECGNTAAASIPLALCKAFDDGRIERGSKILLVGGAAGFSVGVIPFIW